MKNNGKIGIYFMALIIGILSSILIKSLIIGNVYLAFILFAPYTIPFFLTVKFFGDSFVNLFYLFSGILFIGYFYIFLGKNERIKKILIITLASLLGIILLVEVYGNFSSLSKIVLVELGTGNIRNFLYVFSIFLANLFLLFLLFGKNLWRAFKKMSISYILTLLEILMIIYLGFIFKSYYLMPGATNLEIVYFIASIIITGFFLFIIFETLKRKWENYASSKL